LGQPHVVFQQNVVIHRRAELMTSESVAQLLDGSPECVWCHVLELVTREAIAGTDIDIGRHKPKRVDRAVRRAGESQTDPLGGIAAVGHVRVTASDTRHPLRQQR
jgi:hypothetical protein